MTIVAEAITPMAKSLTASITLSVTFALAPLPSPRICSTMISANASKNTAAPGIPLRFPLMRRSSTGSPPKIKPIKAQLVCRGKCSKSGSITKDRPTIATAMPTTKGQRVARQRLKSLKRLLIQPIIVS